jgi:uncharacterized membrane protein
MLEGFLLGIVVAGSLTAGLFFLKFWRKTGDLLFLAFGAAFVLEGLNRLRFLFEATPNEADVSIYVVRLLAMLLILAGILRKRL